MLPGPARTLPVAVSRKRFLTLDFVFILGISDLRVGSAPDRGAEPRPGMPVHRTGARERRGV
ncbi:hypothetical protein GCM10010964_30820 [Caldovatus sediminis]|uniref:Uncharacterized protein n=1 Tax=Caldovatus sediminis TaxID=2041189 RepID=A0A8J3EEI6_9PROT|nr:hypothetical protein GCM10010964_30820 [Caldovatus sediminis]